MPSRKRLAPPVVNQSVLKEVLNEHPDLLSKRNYEGMYLAYREVAMERNLTSSPGSLQGIKQVVGRYLLDWDKTLKEGGKLS